MLDIRVGVIKACRRHENAESLYVEEIDLGEEAPRTIVSGLVRFVPLEQMQGARVLVMCNLKPANMRGITSQGMVLCASNADHSSVELLVPPSDTPIGTRIAFPPHSTGAVEDVLLPFLPPKKKIWEKFQPDFSIDADGTALWQAVPFTTPQGVVKAPTLRVGSTIS
jgi:methionine--tRNA ligase beta chain